MNQDTAKNSVPRFASFRPKLQATSKLQKQAPKDTKKPAKGSTEAEPKQKQKRDGSPSKSASKAKKAPLASQDHSIPLSENNPYVVDITGDEGNVLYGRPHRYSIPLYRRSNGAGSVLGLPPSHKIQPDDGADNSLIIGRRDATKREKYIFVTKKPARKLRIRQAAQSGLDGLQDFVPLDTGRAKKRRRLDGGGAGASPGPADEHYRSIEGKAKVSTVPADRDLEFGSDSSASDGEEKAVDWHVEVRLKISQLSRWVEQAPTSVKTWIELINCHDQLLYKDPNKSVSFIERQNISDIKLSIYKKALKNFEKGDPRHEELLLGMMEEGAKFRGSEFLEKKWQNVLKENPLVLNLWKQYLNYKQTSFTKFIYDRMLGVYHWCIRELKNAIIKSVGEGQEILEPILIYVILRGSLFMREAGYIENSIAIWQALLEYNFFNPDERSPETSAFQEFWDSEVPRIGEKDGIGWMNHPNKSVPGSPIKNSSEPKFQLDENPSFLAWIQAERERMYNSRLPARSDDDIPEDDLYRVVLFVDIQGFLLQIISPSGRLALLNAFIIFCRLPPLVSELPGDEKYLAAWRTDPFLRTDILEQAANELQSAEKPNFEQWFLPSILEKEPAPIELGGMAPEITLAREYRPLPFGFNFRTHLATSSKLFASADEWFIAFPTWSTLYPQNSGPVKLRWLRRVLESLITVTGTNELFAEYYLAFVWRNFTSTCLETAEYLLRIHPKSQRLRAALALIEWDLVSAEKGIERFSNTIKAEMDLKFQPLIQHEYVLLWSALIWKLLMDGSPGQALCQILAIPDGQVILRYKADDEEVAGRFFPPPVRRLIAIQHFNQRLEICAGHSSEAHYHVLMKLLEYLCDPFHTPLPVNPLAYTVPQTEEYYEEMARLHFYVCHISPYKANRPKTVMAQQGDKSPLSILRNFLRSALALYPQNSILLSLNAWSRPRDRTALEIVLRSPVSLEGQHESFVSEVYKAWEAMFAGRGAGQVASSLGHSHDDDDDETVSPANELGINSLRLLLLTLMGTGNKQSASGMLTSGQGAAGGVSDRKAVREALFRAARTTPVSKTLLLLAGWFMREGRLAEADAWQLARVVQEKSGRVGPGIPEDSQVVKGGP
ncbi:MAG: hypothetical protein M1829_005736 [Trizodia sp. TS-e1964]|nr:MAG: hypothetical protein M1829_005736 [Trizodia sp. TS-e1964]